MTRHDDSANKIKAEFELVRYRQKVLRIAMVLFDNVADVRLLGEIGRILEKSSKATSVDEVNSVIQELKQFAQRHHVELPLEL